MMAYDWHTYVEQQYVRLGNAKNAHILRVPHQRIWSKYMAPDLPRFHVISLACNAKSFMLFRLRVTQKALPWTLFSSFCSSLQQIWTNWWKLLVKLSLFFKLDECGFIQTHQRNAVRDVYFNLKFRVWKQAMSCASEKIIIVEVSGDTNENVNVLNTFHVVNSILYKAHFKSGFC